MKPFLLVLVAAAALQWSGIATAQDDPAAYPHRVLRNDTGMRVMVMLVDMDKGFYRGTHFDWAGHIAQAKYRGHTFFGLWRTPHDPTNYEHGAGPTEPKYRKHTRPSPRIAVVGPEAEGAAAERDAELGKASDDLGRDGRS